MLGTDSHPGEGRDPGSGRRASGLAPDPVLGGIRRASVRGSAALGLVTYSLLFVLVAAEAGGIVTSSPVGSPDDPAPSPEALAGAAAPGELVHLVGAVGGLALGASGLVALVLHPQRRALSRQVLAATLALIAAALLVGNPDNVGGQAGAVDPGFLLLAAPPLVAALVARPFRGLRERRRPVLSVLAATALPLAAWWGAGQAANQRHTFPPTADPHHQAHWHVMAAFAFALVLVVAAAAHAGRGWQLGALTAGLGALAFGVTSLVRPDDASALDPAWATVVVAWGLAVLWSVLRGSRGAGRRSGARPLPRGGNGYAPKSV